MHCDDELLAAVAMGADLDLNDVSEEDRRHIAECTVCQGDIAELASTVTHLRASEALMSLDNPSPDVWTRIRADIHHETTGMSTPRRRPVSRTLAVAASAVMLAIGLGLGVSLSPDTGETSPSSLSAAAELRPVGGGQLMGKARLLQTDRGPELEVDATTDSTSSGYLEVWLINEDGQRMISIGVLDEGASQRFAVPQAAVDAGYVIVDISEEQYDDDPTHSGDSIMRGQLG